MFLNLNLNICTFIFSYNFGILKVAIIDLSETEKTNKILKGKPRVFHWNKLFLRESKVEAQGPIGQKRLDKIEKWRGIGDHVIKLMPMVRSMA